MSNTARYRIVQVTGSPFPYRAEYRSEEGTYQSIGATTVKTGEPGWIDIGPCLSEQQAEIAIDQHKQGEAARLRKEPTTRVVRYVE